MTTPQRVVPHKDILACKAKKRYPNERAAIHAAIGSSATFGKPMRWYRCDVCRGYHLTSKVR